jgi:hypothetical protein
MPRSGLCRLLGTEQDLRQEPAPYPRRLRGITLADFSPRLAPCYVPRPMAEIGSSRVAFFGGPGNAPS